jgi:hypothetical protein
LLSAKKFALGLFRSATCAQWKNFVRTKRKTCEVNDTKFVFVLNTTNPEEIIKLVSERTGLSAEKVSQFIKIKTEEEAEKEERETEAKVEVVLEKGGQVEKIKEAVEKVPQQFRKVAETKAKKEIEEKD